jgi:hypothetical protein
MQPPKQASAAPRINWEGAPVASGARICRQRPGLNAAALIRFAQNTDLFLSFLYVAGDGACGSAIGRSCEPFAGCEHAFQLVQIVLGSLHLRLQQVKLPVVLCQDVEFQAAPQRLMFNLLSGERPCPALGLVPAGKKGD